MGVLRPRAATGRKKKRDAAEGNWIATAYHAALAQGVDVEQFWRLTPYQTRAAVAGARDYRVTLAWEVAALSRQKKLPKLSTLLSSQTAHRRDMRELRDMLQSMSRPKKVERHG